MIVTIIAALSVVMIATPVMAQNMTGGNMTGKISGEGINGLTGLGMIPQQEDIKCPPPETEVAEGICGVRQGGGSADGAAATASDDDNGGDTDSGDGGEGQGEDDGEEQEGGN